MTATESETTARVRRAEWSPDHEQRMRTLGRLLERFGLGLILVGVIVTFSVLPETGRIFGSSANAVNLLGGQVVLTLIAIGYTLPAVAGRIDLSPAAIAGLSSVVTASAMSHFDLPLWVACLVAIGAAGTAGVVNGYLSAYLELDSIVVTLATMTLIAGLIQWYTQGLSINTGISEALTTFGSGRTLGVPRTFMLLVAVVFTIWFALEKTPWGRYIRMVGSNAPAARLVGLPEKRLTFSAFVAAGLVAGLAGILLTARTGGANPTDGPGYLLAGLAATFIGATTIQPGKFNILGTVLGVFLVAVIVSGLTLAGAAPYVQQLFNGGALLVAVILSRAMSQGGR